MKRLNERKNADVIDLYVRDAFPKDKRPVWGTKTLRIYKTQHGWALQNYATFMAFRPDTENGKVYVNKTKYSVTTSRQISQFGYTRKLVRISEDILDTLVSTHHYNR